METLDIGRDGGVRAEVLPRGATVHRLLVPTATGPRNVVLGHPSPDDYGADHGYLGATVGRYANRIRGASFELDGTRHTLGANQAGNTLHGGPVGFDSRDWTVVAHEADDLTLALVSEDGDQGFPGRLEASVTYTVTGDALEMVLRATTDAATVVNLTHHGYVNLDGEGAGSVDGHRLTVHADHYQPTDADLVPVGEPAAVDGTPFDLRQARTVADVVRRSHPDLLAARGVDHHFVVGGEGFREMAVVETTDLALHVSSDAPGVQVYTGNFLDGTVPGTGGGVYRQGDGLALEPQTSPDTPNRPEHPDYPLVVLRPGQTYTRRIRWSFTS